MDLDRFNPWWRNELDPYYEDWNKKPLKWIPTVLEQIPLNSFGLHFLVGPRQVGKTTALHLFIHTQLSLQRDPFSIFYYQCDELIDFSQLDELLRQYLSASSARHIEKSLIILDEITSVQEWWRTIKSLIDEKKFIADILILSGSTSIEILKQKERFPGRRGMGLDILMMPLSFQEYARLYIPSLNNNELNIESTVNEIIASNLFHTQALNELFSRYLLTGGFPRPILDYTSNGTIFPDTKRSILDWIRGDLQKSGKNEKYFQEIIQFLLKCRNSPISWLSIAKQTSISSSHTVLDYITFLENIYILRILPLIRPDFIIDSKKNKKIHILDPFVIQVLAEYTHTQLLDEDIVESIVASHFQRKFPTFYWRNNSEIDIVIKLTGSLFGCEVKWGPKNWKKPLHLKHYIVLTKDNLPTFLASINWNSLISQI